MKKTTLAIALLLASNTGQTEILQANAVYDMQILADGVSCFTFGDCSAAVPGEASYLVDNDNDATAATGSADPAFGSAIAGDSLAGVVNITTTDNGAGGVNFTVNSFNMDTYNGTAGGQFATQGTTVATMSGSVDAEGNITFDPTGRDGMAQFFNTSLGQQPWNTNSIFTSGNQVNAVADLTGTALPTDEGNTAVIVSANDVGAAWGFFEGTPYTEVFSLRFEPRKIARPDLININQNTSNNILNVLDNDLPATGLTITSIDTISTVGTVAAISPGVSTTLDYTPPADLTIKSDTISYSMTDGADTYSTTVSITIIDKTVPVIVLNGTDPMNVQNGDTYVEPGANCTDNFDLDKNATIGGAVVNTSVDDTYIVEYDCTDSASNSATMETRSVVVITGDPPPTISVNGSDPLNAPVTPGDSSSFTQAIANSDVACSDNQPNPVLTNDAETTVDTSTLGGPFVVTYECTDSAQQNATPVIRNINVVDEAPPVITPTGPNPTIITVGTPYVEQGASCTDNFDQSPTIEISPAEDAVDTSVVSQPTTVTYNCTDSSGNSALASIVVNIISVAPVINLIGDDEVTLFVGHDYIEEGATCTDDVDVNSEALISGDMVDTLTDGIYTVRYNCTDSDGLDAIEVTRTVTVSLDTEAPTITLNDNDTIELNIGFSYFEKGAVCSDNADDDKAATVGGDTVDTSIEGTYTVDYSCSDLAENIATVVSRTVTINKINSSSTSTTKSDKDDEIGSVNGWLLASLIGLMTARRRKTWSK